MFDGTIPLGIRPPVWGVLRPWSLRGGDDG